MSNALKKVPTVKVLAAAAMLAAGAALADAPMAFDRRVVGYHVDTWTDGTGWVKGPMCKGRSVTLEGEDSIRRLVWMWKRVSGAAFYLR